MVLPVYILLNGGKILKRISGSISFAAAGAIVLTAAFIILLRVVLTPQPEAEAEPAFEAPALSVGSANGNPGETVIIPVNVYSNNTLALLDATVSWDDPSLTSSMAYMDSNMGGIISDNGEGYCMLMVTGNDTDAIPDGTAAYIRFTIPDSAVNGTVYDLHFSAVDQYEDVEGNEHREQVNTYSGSITVGMKATGSSSETTPVITTSTAVVTTAVTTEEKEYDEGYSISISSGKGKPGEKVMVDIMSCCGGGMEAADFAVSWSDPALKLTSVYSAEIKGKVDYSATEDKCSIMVIGEGIEDGVIGRLEFTIPTDAVPGTVYNIDVFSISTFYGSDAVEHADRTRAAGGGIWVTDKSGNLVTTAPVPTDKPVVTTTVSVSGGGTGLSISRESLNMIVGDSLHLKISGNVGGVKWSSSDEETVTVNSRGLVSALKSGSALIVAYVDGEYLTCEVNVEADDIGGDILWGDANEDGRVNVRDAAFIARQLAQGIGDTLPMAADYNRDDRMNVRDAAAIAKSLASGK